MIFSIKFKKNNSLYSKKISVVIILVIFYIINKESIKNKIKICLCVIAKNENLYVREYVEHYKKIGYNNIFIYDNNDINGENFSDVIYDYIQNGYVKIIDFTKRNNNSRPQDDAYFDCYSKNNLTYDWLSFFDMDEFLELNEKYNNIQEFLNDKIFNKCKNIKINWLFSKANNKLYYENKSLSERFKNFDYKSGANIHIKSTVKGNLPINYWKYVLNPHTSSLNITTCSSSGKIISFSSPFNQPPDFTNAKLKHYYFKSFEEFCIKHKRGKAPNTKEQNSKFIASSFKNFYLNNRKNPEKLKIVLKIFNMSINSINISKPFF